MWSVSLYRTHLYCLLFAYLNCQHRCFCTLKEVAGYTALELLKIKYIYFSLSIFRGNKVISLRALDVKTQYILCGTTLFDVRVALCVVLKDGMFMAQLDHKHSRSAGLLWICVQLTRGQQRRKSSSACVLTQTEFCFSFVNSLHPPLRTNKHSSTGKYCDWQPRVVFFPFPTFHGDRGWHFKRLVVVIMISRREL